MKCLWSKNFKLEKCGHTGKSNYGLNLSIILMLLTIYGVEKSQCDSSMDAIAMSHLLTLPDLRGGGGGGVFFEHNFVKK